MNGIKERREALGMKQAELARLIGARRQDIYKVENSTKPLSRKWAERLAPALKCSASDLLFANQKQDGLYPTGEYQGYISVKGNVQGGAWLEIETMEEVSSTFVPIGPRPGYPNNAQYALKVVGNSVNRRIKDGEYAICVDFIESGLAAKNQDLVVVEQEDGGKVQTTIKMLVVTSSGQRELWPVSDDPAHQEQIKLDNGSQNVEVTLRAKVIGQYADFD